jgi:hypothetical protein
MTVDYTKQGATSKLNKEQEKKVKILAFVFYQLSIIFLILGVLSISIDIFGVGETKLIMGGIFIFMSVVEVAMWNLIIKKQIIKQLEAKNETK